MQKKEYETPTIEEIGTLKDFTQYSVIGEGFDGGYPSNFPEIFSES